MATGTMTDSREGPATDPWFVPEWSLPPGVCALQTTRLGGVSGGPWASFNLGGHVGDVAADVAANRRRLCQRLPSAPVWLTQVHGIDVARIDEVAVDAAPPVADAAVATAPGRVCAVMTADCLPVLLCDNAGRVVGAVHAGWRGLCAGVIEAAVVAMAVPPSTLRAWLGPAIGAQAFEVGDDVREAFVTRDAGAAVAFCRGDNGRWLADLPALARRRLQALGVTAIVGGDECTVGRADRYFSYRRDGVSGRMASLIWRILR